MKKILFVSNNMLGGGAEKVLLTILNALDRSKFEVHLVLIKKKGIRLNEVPKDISITYIFDETQSKKTFPKVQNDIEELYRTHISDIYDVEIAFLEGPPTLFVACSNNPKSKKYAWVHVDLIAYPWTSYLFENLDDEKRIYQKFNKIVFVSPSNLESFRKKFGIEDNLIILYNPINDALIKNQSKEFKVYERRFMFCYVASISKHKGQDKLIIAMKHLIDDGFNCCLYLIGEGESRENFILLSENLGIRNHIVFTGYHKNPYPFIKAADVFVHASEGEGFPLVLCESLVLGTPIVATKCNGSVDVLEYGKYGLLSEISTEGLYVAMKEFITNSKKRRNYSKKSREWTRKYIYEEKIKKIELLLEE